MPAPLVQVRPYRLPFRDPFVTAAGTYAAREGWIVRVTAPGGTFGLGEAAPLPGHGGEPPGEVLPALRALGQALGPILAAEGWPGDLAHASAITRRVAASAPDAAAARAAVDLALVDLAARRSAVPLARWLSPSARDGVEVNAVIGTGPPAAAAEAARRSAAEGYRTLKLKVGLDDAADVARVDAIRAGVGPGIALRLDANGAWDRDRAARMLAALARFDIAYVEQPLAAGDIDGMARLRASSPIPIAADEALLEPGGITAVLAARAADVLVLKPALCGGPSVVLGLARTLASTTAGPAVVVTTALDSAVGRLGALHLAAALPGAPLAAGLATGGLLAGDVAATPPVTRGSMAVPDAPGLGIGVAGPWTALM